MIMLQHLLIVARFLLCGQTKSTLPRETILNLLNFDSVSRQVIGQIVRAKRIWQCGKNYVITAIYCFGELASSFPKSCASECWNSRMRVIRELRKQRVCFAQICRARLTFSRRLSRHLRCSHNPDSSSKRHE